jgi:ATP-binding cassette subfamily F protein 3
MVPMIRNILGGFLFSGDDINKRVAVLSGGERNRLALAKMLLNPSNLLLLDEPTNHLDLDSKEVLLDALSDYGGTLIFVSHDRYFVDRLAGKVIEVGGGEAPLYPGGYEDFLYWKKQRAAGLPVAMPGGSGAKVRNDRAETVSGASKPADAKTTPPLRRPRVVAPSPAASPKDGDNGRPAATPAKPEGVRPDPLAPRLRPKGAPPDRQAREREAKRMRARLADLEQRISEKEKAVRDLEARMASPGFYEDRTRAEEAAEAHKKLMWEVGDLLNQWEALQTEVEVRG